MNKITDTNDASWAGHSDGPICRHVFSEGTTLFRKGEQRDCAYLIDKGEVHIYGNDEGGEDKLLCSLGDGEIFGEIALVDDSPRTATAVTVSEAEIFIIPRGALQERIKGLDPVIMLLLSLLIERYRFSRIHMPESIKQDKDAVSLMEKVSKYKSLPVDVMQLQDFDEIRNRARHELGIEQELRQGLKEKQFEPFLQPVLKLPEGRILGFEALIRWNHPEKGMIFPDDFIPVAERTGVVQHLDLMMLEKACENLPIINEVAGDKGPLFIAVNLSGTNFEAIDVVSVVDETLKKYGTDPCLIKLEITESALIVDPDKTEKILFDLKALGVGLSLDDFGTGYSSLGYLHRFSIDTLKIDRSFVMQLHDDRRSLDIVEAIINLAKTFKLGIVAEGIEQEQDVNILNSLGCDMGQGYLFSKPVPLDQACDFIRENLAKAA